MVYFVQSENGSIKIGYAKNPLNRLSGLQTSSSEKLSLLGVISGGMEVENTLHDRFKTEKIRGEWFKPSKSLLDFISENASKSEIPKDEKAKDFFELSIGNSIKRLRLLKNIDRETLCKMAGVSMNAVRHLENGSGASIKTLVKVAQVLGKSDWLLGISPEISINPLHGKRQRQRASKR